MKLITQIYKAIFSDKARTTNFLENVLVGKGKILPEGTEIQELQYLPTEPTQVIPLEYANNMIFYLQVKTSNGMFIIEMHKFFDFSDYLKKLEFYNSIAYTEQQIKVTEYSDTILPRISISVVYQNLCDYVPCVSYPINVERKTQKQPINAMSYVLIELENYEYSHIFGTTRNAKDKQYFIKTQDINRVYEHVISAVKHVRNEEDKIKEYEKYLTSIMMALAAQKEIENAIEEGKIKGKIKGENEAKIEVAKKMLIKTITEIIEFTGLTKEQITEMQEEIN